MRVVLLLCLCACGCAWWEARKAKVGAQWAIVHSLEAQAQSQHAWALCLEEEKSGQRCGPPPPPAVTIQSYHWWGE